MSGESDSAPPQTEEEAHGSQAHVISTVNPKSGVGKTTTTAGLAEFLSAEFRKRVLVIDLDPVAVRKLTNLANRYRDKVTFTRLKSTHAKGLVHDDVWVTTSFNWLSFKGDPDRTYRTEEESLVRNRQSGHPCRDCPRTAVRDASGHGRPYRCEVVCVRSALGPADPHSADPRLEHHCAVSREPGESDGRPADLLGEPRPRNTRCPPPAVRAVVKECALPFEDSPPPHLALARARRRDTTGVVPAAGGLPTSPAAVAHRPLHPVGRSRPHPLPRHRGMAVRETVTADQDGCRAMKFSTNLVAWSTSVHVAKLVRGPRLQAMGAGAMGGRQSDSTLETYMAVADREPAAKIARTSSLFQTDGRFRQGLTNSQKSIFAEAAERRSRMIVGDLETAIVHELPGTVAVDDVLVDAEGVPIDGTDHVPDIVVQAGPTRSAWHGSLPPFRPTWALRPWRSSALRSARRPTPSPVRTSEAPAATRSTWTPRNRAPCGTV
ncbi:nucleotide-binding protein [Streptomyces sp. NBC_01235]|uniref:nucleotide-binding protein n=1 Tax=Streptomyces sp. NBC_01235 TaxID=2903788 RepID=UPI002E10FB3A|nr:AAA family ATPase [Streptomyces sp. NBC_01235]